VKVEHQAASQPQPGPRRAPGAPRVRLVDVARAAGVSPATASLVLSGRGGRGRASEATKQRVLEAARDLGYRVDELARGLRTRRSYTVALIFPEIMNPFYPMVACGLSDAVNEAGYLTLICHTDRDPGKETAYISRVLDRRVDGIVITGTDNLSRQLRQAIATVPVTVLGETPMESSVVGMGADLVKPDDYHAAYEVTSHLLKAGRRIAIIDGPPGFGQSRYRGYVDALEKHGLRPVEQMVAHSDSTRSGGAAAMRQLLEYRPRLDGVFCVNDMMAIGALDAARAEGLSVPEDLVVGGFDDIEAASLVTPALTTTVNPAYKIGHTAGTVLVERMTDNFHGPGRVFTLPCKLIIRASSSIGNPALT
jgi:LacI family transcriptional regulator